MDPFTIIMIISAIAGAFGAYQQGEAARTQAKYQSRVSQANAKTAEMEAAYAKRMANKAAGEQHMKARRLAASQRAAQGASGFVAGVGSFGDILEDTAVLGEVDALAIRHEGAIDAWRSTEKAKMFSAESKLYKSQSKDYSSNLVAAGTLLTGLSGIDYGGGTAAVTSPHVNAGI